MEGPGAGVEDADHVAATAPRTPPANRIFPGNGMELFDSPAGLADATAAMPCPLPLYLDTASGTTYD